MTTPTDDRLAQAPRRRMAEATTPEQYNILRKHGAERAGTSPLDHEKRKGAFACAGCELPLFSSDTKFESAPAGRASISRSTTRVVTRPTAPSS